MAFHKMELFGYVTYGPELSYHELLEREEEVKDQIQRVLEKAEGAFIHFEALGDSLRFQCMLPEEREEVFHVICDELATVVKNDLDARLLVVDKNLDAVYCYVIVGGKWQESTIALPVAGKLATVEPVKVGKILTDHPGAS